MVITVAANRPNPIAYVGTKRSRRSTRRTSFGDFRCHICAKHLTRKRRLHVHVQVRVHFRVRRGIGFGAGHLRLDRQEERCPGWALFARLFNHETGDRLKIELIDRASKTADYPDVADGKNQHKFGTSSSESSARSAVKNREASGKSAEIGCVICGPLFVFVRPGARAFV